MGHASGQNQFRHELLPFAERSVNFLLIPA
jgi:hypothetical protein